MPISKLTPEGNYPYMDERIRALAQAVPEAMADGKINWEKLREALGDAVEEENASEEHFGLSWPGKREARKLAAQPSLGTLVPVPGEGINEDDTENIFIEGDNLEVMKLLLKSYAGRIKMIYIDPPYNTGNDFIYNDNFADPLEAYLEYTGAKGESGELLTTNTRADGRFHSKWLNMMYLRLLLAHKLLREDGVIFVSIDDNELINLKYLLNEIFGEENFIECIIWKKRYNAAKEKHLASIHEYILFYAKNKHDIEKINVPMEESYIKDYFKNKDLYFEDRGPYMTQPLEAGNTMDDRKNLQYPIPAPDGSIILPRRQWIWSKERTYKAIDEDYLEFKQDSKGKWSVRYKYYLKNESGDVKGRKAFSLIDDVYTQEGTKEIESIFSDKNVFPFPKPTKLIKHLINIGTSTENEAIILDFFCGSGSSSHAVIDLNIENSRNLKFFAIQMPEKNGGKEFLTISDICKERIRRVISKLENKQDNRSTVKEITNLGFKVYQYYRSNYKKWQNEDEASVEKVETLFENTINPLIDGYQANDLLTEILLLEGFPLTSKVAIQDEYLKNYVYLVSAPDFCEHNLVICLDEIVHDSTVSQLTMEEKDILICLDSALTDEAKARLQDRFNMHVI